MTFNNQKRNNFYVPKGIFDAWRAANDPDHAIDIHLTPDGAGYEFVISDTETALQAQIIALAGAKKFVERVDFRNFKSFNPTIFDEGDNPGDAPPGLMTPFHPDEMNVFEYGHLYDGTNATMAFNAEGDSTWTFKAGVIATLDDVIIGDDMIRINKNKFGPMTVPSNENRYIYLDSDFVLMRTWKLKTKNIVNNETVVTLEIPPLGP